MLLNRLETKFLDHYFVFKLGNRDDGGYYNDIIRFELIQRFEQTKIKDAIGLDGRTVETESTTQIRKRPFAEIVVDHSASELKNEKVISGKNSWSVKIADLLAMTSKADASYSLYASLNINSLFSEEMLSSTSIPVYEICDQLKKYLAQGKSSASLKESAVYFREVDVYYPFTSFFISPEHPWME